MRDESNQLEINGCHGKSKVNILMRIRGVDGKMTFIHFEVQCLLMGSAMAESFTAGDNRLVVPTDTVKNTCYAVATKFKTSSPLIFMHELAKEFLGKHGHLDEVEVELKRFMYDPTNSDLGFIKNNCNEHLKVCYPRIVKRPHSIPISNYGSISELELAVVTDDKSGYSCKSYIIDCRWKFNQSTTIKRASGLPAIVRRIIISGIRRHNSTEALESIIENIMRYAAIDHVIIQIRSRRRDSSETSKHNSKKLPYYSISDVVSVESATSKYASKCTI